MVKVEKTERHKFLGLGSDGLMARHEEVSKEKCGGGLREYVEEDQERGDCFCLPRKEWSGRHFGKINMW
ncbi:hypothetical protein ACH5RR_026584 [Cinchona calisaya]|uniref:Uncharacterized protein n=1 Tax=Cinchona calisaya TaxID=153742 RepID=A0ABD2Z301_9GENT